MKNKEENTRISHNVDRSPVVALLLAHYRGIQIERIVLSTSMRVLWFALLLVFALIPVPTVRSLVPFGIIAITLFFVSFYASRRTQWLETSIRDSLVRLDPELQDYYIKVLHGARERPLLSPLDIMVFMLRRGEDFFWLMSSIWILITRTFFIG